MSDGTLSSVEEEAAELLEEITEIYKKDTHGESLENHTAIAEIWTWYLKHKHGVEIDLDAVDAAQMLVLFKSAREATGEADVDHFQDQAGYSGLAGAMAQALREDDTEQTTEESDTDEELSYEDLRPNMTVEIFGADKVFGSSTPAYESHATVCEMWPHSKQIMVEFSDGSVINFFPEEEDDIILYESSSYSDHSENTERESGQLDLVAGEHLDLGRLEVGNVIEIVKPGGSGRIHGAELLDLDTEVLVYTMDPDDSMAGEIPYAEIEEINVISNGNFESYRKEIPDEPKKGFPLSFEMIEEGMRLTVFNVDNVHPNGPEEGMGTVTKKTDKHIGVMFDERENDIYFYPHDPEENDLRIYYEGREDDE